MRMPSEMSAVTSGGLQYDESVTVALRPSDEVASSTQSDSSRSLGADATTRSGSSSRRSRLSLLA